MTRHSAIKNQTLELTIEDLHTNGQGIAHFDNQTYHVPFCLPGEVVAAKVIKKSKGIRFCELQNVLEASPTRIKATCTAFGECGGCALQHMSISDQLDHKMLWLQKTLQSLGSFKLHNIIASPLNFKYRNRITLHHDKKNIGFYKPLSHEIVSIQNCPIASDALNEQLKNLTPDILKGPEAFELREDKSATFLQINSLQNKNLIQTVLNFLPQSKSQSVLELYCGAGNISFSLKKRIKKLLAYDSDSTAIEIALKQKREAELKGFQFEASPVHDAVFELCQALKSFDTIICDPPREGLRETATILNRLKFKDLIYVSCQPQSFVKDMFQLQKQGYELIEVQPLDMFPQTAHIEIVARIGLTRN